MIQAEAGILLLFVTWTYTDIRGHGGYDEI